MLLGARGGGKGRLREVASVGARGSATGDRRRAARCSCWREGPGRAEREGGVRSAVLSLDKLNLNFFSFLFCDERNVCLRLRGDNHN